VAQSPLRSDELPLVLDCHPPAQETRLGILGLAPLARPLISASVGVTSRQLALDLDRCAARIPPDPIRFWFMKEVEMRTIGIDLSVKSEHKAIVMDERGRFVSRLIPLRSQPAALIGLLAEAQPGNSDGQLQAVMEPTGMAWFPVAVFLICHGVRVYLVNSQQVADLRRYYHKHAKSDRIDARVLARLPLVDEDQLHPLELAGATALACQRGCKQLDRLGKQHTACKNRLIALDRFAWPGLEATVFADLFGPAASWFREHWYHPVRVCQAGAEKIRQTWQTSGGDPEDAGEWAVDLVQLAEQVVALYGAEGAYLDYDRLQAEAAREQAYLAFVAEQHHCLKLQTVRPLYRQLHPSRHLESIPGVGQDGAAVYASFIGNPQRFASLRAHRGWSGMVPNSKQSAERQASGLKITQAGPSLIKKFAYLDAEVARQRDPQIAAVYYEQMVHHGKHHTQAICACAAHLLDRVLVVLKEDRPYELRDVDGTPVSKKRALEIIVERYTVPEEVRRRNTQRTRRERAERRAERKQQKRESRSANGQLNAPKQQAT
jgi:transposase